MKRVTYKSAEELHAAVAALASKGGAFHVVILHDDACTPAGCVCTPEFVLEELTVENYRKGQEAQEAWRKGK